MKCHFNYRSILYIASILLFRMKCTDIEQNTLSMISLPWQKQQRREIRKFCSSEKRRERYSRVKSRKERVRSQRLERANKTTLRRHRHRPRGRDEEDGRSERTKPKRWEDGERKGKGARRRCLGYNRVSFSPGAKEILSNLSRALSRRSPARERERERERSSTRRFSRII